MILPWLALPVQLHIWVLALEIQESSIMKAEWVVSLNCWYHIHNFRMEYNVTERCLRAVEPADNQPSQGALRVTFCNFQDCMNTIYSTCNEVQETWNFSILVTSQHCSNLPDQSACSHYISFQVKTIPSFVCYNIDSDNRIASPK